ncbi:response regulator [Halobaculum litoreum]|uniref:Response regulator n=1 Tax=Halobaculum litoreum TaxID=3031998 RepID=A0ABD5XTY0_9EURY
MTTGYGDSEPRPRVLHVDDDESFLDLVAAFLVDRHGFEVVSVSTVGEGLDVLADADCSVECVVSDYEMPGADGLEFLRRVREVAPDLPFVLYTGRGSESVAADAIAAGVTEYIQKETGTAQYAVLANRIEQAVDRYRADRRADRRAVALESAREGIALLDADGRFEYVNPAYAALYQHEPQTLRGADWRTVHPDSAVEHIESEVLPAVDADGGGAAPRRDSGRTGRRSPRRSRSARSPAAAT